MAGYKTLFIIDPIEVLNKKLDTSLRLAHSHAVDLKNESYFCHIEDLFYHSKNKYSSAKVQKFEFVEGPENFNVTPCGVMSLDQFDIVYKRKDPPYDLNYIGASWMLDFLPASTLVINKPSALRDFNEKLIILNFPEYIDSALVSQDPHQILDFIERIPSKDAVVKPLDLFAGRGIVRVDLKELSPQQAFHKIDEAIKEARGLRMVQPFNPQISRGEIRVFCAGGQAISWCLKIPQAGNYLANTSAGAKLQDYQPSDKQVVMVESMAKRLLTHGIYWTGMDIIGDYVSEINITSPRLLSMKSGDRPYQRVAESDIISLKVVRNRLGHRTTE